MTDVLGSYVPRNKILHRISPGPKLVGLFLASLALLVFGRPGFGSTSIAVSGAALVISAVLVSSSGIPRRRLWRLLAGFTLVAVPLFAFQVWQQDALFAAQVVSNLIALILAASAVTASTAPNDMLDTLTRGLGPLIRLGVSPERIALAFSLTISAIPQTLQVARETRQAAQARGLERSPRAQVVPFVLRTVAHAQLRGEALAARGIGDD